MTAASGNYFSVYLNSLPTPFNTPTLNFTTTNVTYPFGNNAQLVQGFNIAQSPLGYSTIGALYDKYVVLKYRLEITFMPASIADTARMIAVPIGNEEFPSLAAGVMNDRTLEEQPYALATTCSSGATAGPANSNTLVLEGCPYKDLGITREQYLADGLTPIGNVPTTQYVDFGGVFLQQLNGANNGSTTMCQIKLTQIVRLSDVISQV